LSKLNGFLILDSTFGSRAWLEDTETYEELLNSGKIGNSWKMTLKSLSGLLTLQ